MILGPFVWASQRILRWFASPLVSSLVWTKAEAEVAYGAPGDLPELWREAKGMEIDGKLGDLEVILMNEA